jgi:arylsulfatase A-like enzyme
MPRNFFDKYEGRTAAMKQDMTIDKTMQLKSDLKIGVDYNKPGMYGRMSPQEKAAYKTYYDKAGEEYEKVKNDSVALVKWKFQRYLRDYLSTAKSMDRNIGRILDELDAMGLKENTIVIYASDQGFYMGEHGWFDKRFMYEESFRTPFVIRYPGHIKAEHR